MGATSIGLDVGATLAKIAISPREGGEPTFEQLPSADLGTVAAHVTALGPTLAGLTGGGAARLAPMLACRCEVVGEFDAWGKGALRLLEGAEDGPPPDQGFLLVSLGTGTGIFHLKDGKTTRVGGTGVGGGVIAGLGSLLTGAGFVQLCELAVQGDSGAVDLRVSDIYRDEEFPLAGHLTAANFGKLAHQLSAAGPVAEPDARDRADRAAAIMRLVGETVALFCAVVATGTSARHVVYGGSTLRGNARLVEVLTELTALCGLQPCFLPHAGFPGALGALQMARSRAGRGN